MLLLVLLLVCVGLFLYATKEDLDPMDGISVFFGVTFLIFILLFNVIAYVCQINDITELNVIEARKEVYEKRAENITFKLKSVVQEYAGHEEMIFENISPSDIQLYAVKYPEIKSDKLYSEYSETLIELYDAIYRLEQNKISLGRNIERRKRYHLHLITFLIPRN